MALIFQYGSNMSTSRLNSDDRLAGDARVLGVARTKQLFEFGFTVFSTTNQCAAADITPGSGRSIHGVLYELPEKLIYRDSAKKIGRKSLDAIEGEGSNYSRTSIELVRLDGSLVTALTYVVRKRSAGLVTSFEYVCHILAGAAEHSLPQDYILYLIDRILANNPALESALDEYRTSA